MSHSRVLKLMISSVVSNYTGFLALRTPFQILKGLLMCCDESLASINTDDIIGGVKLHQLVRHFENEGRHAVEASIV